MAVEDGRVTAEDLAGVFEQMLRREVSTSRTGSAFELEHTNPRRMSLTATILTLKPMLMPGVGHLGRLDLRRQAGGRERHDIPGLERAGLDAADGMPPILNTSWRGRRSGLFDGADRGLGHHGRLSPCSIMLSPTHPLLGMNWTFSL